MRNLTFLIAVFIFLILLPACITADEIGTPAAKPLIATPTQDLTATAESSGASVPIPPATITLTPFLPSSTPVPASPTPTPTPTSLQLEPITAENAGRLQEIMRWGAPVVWDVVLSGDGQVLAAATSGGALLFDAQTQEKLFEIPIVPLQQNGVAINQDGSRIVLVTRTDVQFFDLSAQTSLILRTFPNGTDQQWWFRPTAAISPDGNLAVMGYQAESEAGVLNLFDVYDAATGEVVFSERGSNPVFSPVGDLLAVEFDRSVWFWNLEDWTRRTNIFLDETWNTRHVFSPDGALTAVSRPEQVEIWRLADRRLIRVIEAFQQEDYPPRIVFSPDSSLIGIWETGEEVSVWEVDSGNRKNVAKLPGVGDIVLNDQGEVSFLEAPDLGHSNIQLGFQLDFRFLEDGSLLAINNHWLPEWHNEACLYFMDGSFACIERQGIENEFVADMDGNIYEITGAGSGNAQIWLDEELIAELAIEPGWPLRIVDGYLINIWNSTRNLMHIEVWDLETQNNQRYVTGEYPAAMQVSNDGRWLAILARKWNGRELLVFELPGLELVYLHMLEGLPEAITFSEDSTRLLFAEGDSIPKIIVLALESRTAQTILPLVGTAKITALLMWDGLLAAGFDSGALMMIDPEVKETIAECMPHGEAIVRIAISPAYSRIATSSLDGFVVIQRNW